MMNTYNMLILVKSSSESERIITIFRRNDLLVRAHRITSNEDLRDHLNDDNWDILIADNRHPEVSLPLCLDILKNKAPDLPLLLLASDLSHDHKNQLTKLGVTDIIEKSDERFFLHAAKREMINSRNRQKNRSLQLAFDELQNRAEKLLSESKESIAYIADGILIDCNNRFAEMLGYDTSADLEYTSFIDMVDNADKNQFKQLVKLFAKSEAGINQSTLRMLKRSGDSISIDMALQKTSINHEPCIQVNLSTAKQTKDDAQSSNDHTGLQSLDILAEPAQLFSACARLPNYCFILIVINEFSDLKRELLITGEKAILTDLSSRLRSDSRAMSTYPLSSDMLLCLFPSLSDDAMNFLQGFFSSQDNHIFEFGNTSLAYTVSCVITQVGSHEINSVIDQAAKALYEMSSQHINQASILTQQPPSEVSVSLGEENTKDFINNDNLDILYQPIMSLHGDKRENYEVTFRQKSTIDLLPLLTDSSLDRWIIIEATKALSQHRENGHDTRLFINLSAFALNDETFPAWIKIALKASNLPIDSIIFQIDADDVKSDIKGAIHLFCSLRKNKQQLSLKNVNPSNKSLTILNHIEPQFVCLKDQIITDINDDHNLDSLKKLLNSFSEMNIESLVVNVSNAAELATLWQLGVSYITGSYLQSPADSMNFEFTPLH